MLLLPLVLQAQINVLTNRYDPARTGANLAETTLTAANVNATRFGKLYSYPVDGAVYAQPLYVAGVAINGTRRNVLYVATMNDKLYAFDADSPSPTPLWTAAFHQPAGVNTGADHRHRRRPICNIVGNVGIQSTPVIDPATGTLYLVARTKESGALRAAAARARHHHRSRAAGQPGDDRRPRSRHGPTRPSGDGQRVITFDPKMQVQRAGLALEQRRGAGRVGGARGHHAEPRLDHGLRRRHACAGRRLRGHPGCLCSAASGRADARRRSTPAGNAYFATGNGNWDGTRNFGDSLLKFGVSRTGPDAGRLLHPRQRSAAQRRRRRPERIGLHAAARDASAARRRQGGRALSAQRRQPGTQGRRTTRRSCRRFRSTAATSWAARCSGTRRAPDRSSTTGRKTTCLTAYRPARRTAHRRRRTRSGRCSRRGIPADR